MVKVSIPGDNGTSMPAIALHINQRVQSQAPTCTTVAVKFRVANANVATGQSLHVVGNLSQIGKWVPTSTNQLKSEGAGANSAFSNTFHLPPSTPIQFKFLRKAGATNVWERDQSANARNREVTTVGCGQPTQVLDVGNFAF